VNAALNLNASAARASGAFGTQHSYRVPELFSKPFRQRDWLDEDSILVIHRCLTHSIEISCAALDVDLG
jgi:hypothetical protein